MNVKAKIQTVQTVGSYEPEAISPAADGEIVMRIRGLEHLKDDYFVLKQVHQRSINWPGVMNLLGFTYEGDDSEGAKDLMQIPDEDNEKIAKQIHRIVLSYGLEKILKDRITIDL